MEDIVQHIFEEDENLTKSEKFGQYNKKFVNLQNKQKEIKRIYQEYLNGTKK